MSRWTERIKKEFTAPMERVCAIFLIIVGILMGTVFAFGIQYWKGRVTKENAISVEATFLSYKETYGKYTLNGIVLYFEDYKQLDVDGSCLSDSVADRVRLIKPGAVLALYIHPHSSTILEMVDNGDVIIEFDETMDRLSTQTSGFMVLGFLMYLCATFGATKLIRKKVY